MARIDVGTKVIVDLWNVEKHKGMVKSQGNTMDLVRAESEFHLEKGEYAIVIESYENFAKVIPCDEFSHLIANKKFKIDIRLDLPKELEQQEAETPVESEHVVSMYVGGQLVVSYRKLHTAELSKEIAAIPRPYKIDPYDSSAEPKPDMGFSILGAAVAAINTLKGLLNKKDTKALTRPVVKKTQISTRFIRINPSGGKLAVTAVISLWLE